jgi:hypothetical protein
MSWKHGVLMLIFVRDLWVRSSARLVSLRHQGFRSLALTVLEAYRPHQETLLLEPTPLFVPPSTMEVEVLR